MRTTIGRIAFLAFAFVLLAAATSFFLNFVGDGIDARMMAFQSAPIEGHDYWWWRYFRESLPGNFPVIGALIALWIFWAWACVATIRKAYPKSR
ncbi:MAG TPA: hypothetical protein VIU12_06835 [Chryseolinea sp.]